MEAAGLLREVTVISLLYLVYFAVSTSIKMPCDVQSVIGAALSSGTAY
jgi:hypothetical protein